MGIADSKYLVNLMDHLSTVDEHFIQVVIMLGMVETLVNVDGKFNHDNWLAGVLVHQHSESEQRTQWPLNFGLQQRIWNGMKMHRSCECLKVTGFHNLFLNS